LYQAALAQFSAADEQSRQELYNRLQEYNAQYGDGIEANVTKKWEDALTAYNKYAEATSSTDTGTIRTYM